ncbi:uncharacterized protein ACO6RY_08238 [Pungitius sinensis]
MRLLLGLLCALLSCGDATGGGSTGTGGESTGTGPAPHVNEGNVSHRTHARQEALQHRPPDAASDSLFDLKVQVNNVMSRQYLSQALVEVYINHTRTNAALTGQDGGALLRVPYQSGTPITLVASKDGYLCTLLPCRTSRMPIFSSVTMSLLGLNQGNIWLFNDSVLITGKTSDATSQPIVQFPKSLLNLTDSSEATSVQAYLTLPKLPSEEGSFHHTLGIMRSESGYVSVELSPLAAVSVQLFSGASELHVSGPIQISLSIPDSCGLRTSNVVPAWFLNRTTGGWMRKGLGTVVSLKGRLMWTFTAPHLGYWVAAPLSSTRGFFGMAVPVDLISHHSSLLMLVLGGMLVVATCLLVGLLFYRRPSPSQTKTKIRPVMRRDQTTLTCDGVVHEASSADSSPLRGDEQEYPHVIANPSAVAIRVDQLQNNTDLIDPKCLHETTGHGPDPAPLTENLWFYNQPVAVFPAPAFFHVEERPQRSESATLPRGGSAAEPPGRDGITQTPPEGPPAAQNRAADNEDQLGVLQSSRSPASASRRHLGLTESASVPGTLNRIRGGGGRHSVHAFAELSKSPSAQPPRAWFVSLEGKPAAEIRYAVSEQQRRRRPAESRETSLDSGVDMSELNQAPGRRVVTLERNATFVKSSKPAPP